MTVLPVMSAPVDSRWLTQENIGTGLAVFFSIVALSVAMYILRSVLVCAARIVGLYNPDLYAFFPRFPWRTLTHPIYAFRVRWRASLKTESPKHLASPVEAMRFLYKPGDLFVGRLLITGLKWLPDVGGYMPIGLKPRGHLCIVAGTGGGKSTSLISMLAMYPGNAFVIDPKGQISEALLDRCGEGGDGVIGKGKRAFLLDPYGLVKGRSSAHWNPFAELRRVRADQGDKVTKRLVEKYAFAMIPEALGTGDNAKFFADASRQFVVGLMLLILETEPEHNQCLSLLRNYLHRTTYGPVPDDISFEDLIAQPGYMASLDAVIRYMGMQDAFGGAIRDSVTLLQQSINEGEIGSLLSNAQTTLGWIENVEGISDRSDFDFSELQNGDASLFVVASTTDVSGPLKGWFRLLTTAAHQAFELEGESKRDHRTIFVIDEMPSLGKIDVLASGFKVMRGYGILLVAITQDFTSLRSIYEADAVGFRNNSDTLWMRPGTTSDGVELKDIEELHEELNGAIDLNKLKLMLNVDHGGGNLIITTRDGSLPKLVRIPHYFLELPVYYYSESRAHPETGLRRGVRAIARTLIKRREAPPEVRRMLPPERRDEGAPEIEPFERSELPHSPELLEERRDERPEERREERRKEHRKKRMDREGDLGSSTLVLSDEDGRSVRFRIATSVGRASLSEFGTDAGYASDKQFRIRPTPDGWMLEAFEATKHATVVNGIMVKRPVTLRSGDTIAIESRVNSTRKLPLRVEIVKCTT